MQDQDERGHTTIAGYTFKDVGLLEEAITHSSYRNEHKEVTFDNERLEFLGDSVLHLVAAHLVYEECEEAHEGFLTRLKSRLISAETLAECARSIGLRDLLKVGKGASDFDLVVHSQSVLSSAMEALVGAIYLDGGFEAANRVARDLLRPWMEEFLKDPQGLKDPKSLLQEKCLARHHDVPKYRVLQDTGPSHRPWFKVEVRLPSGDAYVGEGHSRKSAEKDAAKNALAQWPEESGNQRAGSDEEGTSVE